MADKNSIFNKYKAIDENGEINTEEPKKADLPETMAEEPVAEEKTLAEEIVIEDAVFPQSVAEEIIAEEVKEDLSSEEKSDSENTIVPQYVFKDDEEVDEIIKSLSSGSEEETTQEAEEPTKENEPEAVAEETVEAVKKEKKVKAPKEKKVKEPKPPKEKKIKEPKPSKEKKVKEPKQPKEKKEVEAEPVTKKDYITIALALVAVVLAVSFVMIKYFPRNDDPTVSGEQITVSEQDLARIQVSRNGMLRNLVQSDIPNVFYQFASDYSLQFYQYRDNQMVPVKTTGTVSAKVDYGVATLPVEIDYVQVGSKIFGIGLFRSDKHPEIKLYSVPLIMFKMTNLPSGYDSNGKALLVAKATSAADLEKVYDEWTESYTVDIATGKTTRFLKIINRNIDTTTATYVDDFCVLTTQGYNSTNGKIPFITARDYDVGSDKEDIYLKSGSSESVLIRNVSKRLLITDGDAVIFMRYNQTGFDVIRKEGGKEYKVFSFVGSTNRCIFFDEYILDKEKATLYNLKTGEETVIVGYKMTNPKMAKISPDGKYLIVMGEMDNVLDYQIHIFNLETGDYAKFIDKNFSEHTNLSFVDQTTIMYMVVDPNQGRECVILDISKAFG